MNTTQKQADRRTPNPTAMRAAAAWFLDQRMLPRHEVLKLWSEDLSGFIEQLLPQIEVLAVSLPPSDVPARVAMAGAGEARRRLREPQAAGLTGETERVKRLARSVVALCDHIETLDGTRRMCLACDKPIEDGQESAPYGKVSPSGGAVSAGRVHAACVSA